MANVVKDDALEPHPAQALLASSLSDVDRLLILGAGGWFGMSLLEVLAHRLAPKQVMTMAERARQVRVGHEAWDLLSWDAGVVRDFSPTVVVNFAFLTRDRIPELGETQYRRVNEELLLRYKEAASLPGVRAVVTASSGAVVQGPDDAYARLKRMEEGQTLSLRTAARATVIARAFSVSGIWVRRPAAYAFSDLITQARLGDINVRADRPTWRRYVDAGEYLAVCLSTALRGSSALVESGGELIEMGTLAERIAQTVNPSATISRAAKQSSVASVYASNGQSWVESCRALGYTAMDLDAQIRRAGRMLPG